MKLELSRSCGPNSTAGKLFVNGVWECFTLERPFDNGANKPCVNAILPGTYQIALSFSPKFNRDMPHILGTPGRSSILIHWGNRPTDSEGCILVGQAQGVDLVTNSRTAFDNLYAKLLKAWKTDKDITITIN